MKLSRRFSIRFRRSRSRQRRTVVHSCASLIFFAWFRLRNWGLRKSISVQLLYCCFLFLHVWSCLDSMPETGLGRGHPSASWTRGAWVWGKHWNTRNSFQGKSKNIQNKHNTGHTGLIIINYPGFMIPLCSSAQKSTFPSAIFSLSRVSGLQAQLSSQAGTSYSFGEAGAALGVTWGQWRHTLYINLYGVIPCYTEFCIFYVWNWLQLCICAYVIVTYKNTYVLHTRTEIYIYPNLCVCDIYIYIQICVCVRVLVGGNGCVQQF